MLLRPPLPSPKALFFSQSLVGLDTRSVGVSCVVRRSGPFASQDSLFLKKKHAHLAHTPDTSRRTPHTTYRSTERALDACTIARPSYYTYPRATRATSLRLSLSSSLCGSALSVTALPLCPRTAHARGASTTAAPKVSHATFAARCELPHRFTQRSNSGRRARGTARRRGPRVCVWDARPFGPAVAAFTTALLVAGRWDGGSARAGKGEIAGGRANTCQTT